MRREGIPCVSWKLGARRDAGPFEAHAWVECAGVAR
ncbi:MAG: lasso peptide biosynthesis B2 protein [Betaproteobacteria bacterium]|nr:lasso peptide biosynthesis B2 protein [Betaproteobacteria bacterium]